MIGEWLRSGRLLDAILLLIVLEAVVLGWWHSRTGRGIAPLDLCLNLAAGALLLLALRAALSAGVAAAAAPWLAAALVAHVADLARRWQR
jgi:hypothetical protein